MKLTKLTIIFILLLACAGSVSAQKLEFNNELEGFEFYNQGKLKNIELKVTTRNQVKAIFDDDCEIRCSYNDDWEMSFFFYFEGCKKEKLSDGFKYTYTVSPQFVDKLFAITLHPKKPVSFKDISFSNKFEKYIDTMIHSGIELRKYSDSKGLLYSIFNEGRIKDNLRYIQYTIPENLEKDVFILTQIQDKSLIDN